MKLTVNCQTSDVNRESLSNNCEQFIVAEKTKDAAIRNFEVVSEAAGRLPDDFKQTYFNIT